MSYRTMWFRLREQLIEAAKKGEEEKELLFKKDYTYREEFAKEMLFAMLEAEQNLELENEVSK